MADIRRAELNRAVVAPIHEHGSGGMEFHWYLLESPGKAILSFGFPDRNTSPKNGCVQIRACNGDVMLDYVGHLPCCCIGGGMPRGGTGTVRMLQGALLLASRQPAFAGMSSVDLMDISHRAPSAGGFFFSRHPLTHRVSCGDVHIIKDPDHHGWYERHFGASLSEDFSRSRSAVLRALGQAVTCSEGSFVAACARAARRADIVEWFEGARSRRAAEIFAEALHIGATWATLLSRLMQGLSGGMGDDDDDDGEGVLLLLSVALGVGEFCPGWVTSHGWCWSIPKEAILAYPVSVEAIMPPQSASSRVRL